MRGLLWAWSPQRLLVSFLAATLVPSAALLWLGWQLMEQDRRLEGQRVVELLENSTTGLSVAIEGRLAAIDRELASGLANHDRISGTGTAITVRVTPSDLLEQAGAPLLYRPAALVAHQEADDAIWAEAEQLEFVGNDRAAALRRYRALARSIEPTVRAGALVRLARVLRNTGRHDEALDAYAALEQLTDATVNGDPADLLARWARLDMLTALRGGQVRQREPAALRHDLEAGRWSIGRDTYLMYARDLARWTGVPPAAHDSRMALTEAVVSAWTAWMSQSSAELPRAGRRVVSAGAIPILLLWHDAGNELRVFASTVSHLTAQLRNAWPDPWVDVALVDEDGEALVGHVAPAAAAPPVIRLSSDTGLPFTLRLTARAIPADITAASVTRRRIVIAGLALIAFLLPASGYLVARSVQHELAVARQQADFVSAVSHEFRSPLTSITHLTSLLSGENEPAGTRRRQYYAVLARETDRLKRFVETLLDFGRIQAGPVPYRLEPLDPTTFVTDLVEDFRTHGSAGGHVVTLASCGPGAVVAADRDALGRAVWNLLENAAKYSPDDNPIEVHVEAEDHQVVIRVTDRGVGIPAAEQPHVFRQFFRGDAARASAVKGTGVGLAVVDHIVRAHGGEVRLESRVGTGSTFSVVLPAARGTAADEVPRRAS